MALDGAFLRHIKKEIEQRALGSRIDKIHQPNKEELIISMRSKEGNYKLLVSSRANSPRIHFTKTSPENPSSPPMLCMLMRKKLLGAKLIGVRQPGLERILYLDFNAKNELGDTIILTLIAEVMGKYSNIILIDENEKIIDAIKRVDAEMSSQRLVLPGIKYKLPPPQDKLCMLDCNAENIIESIIKSPRNEALSKSILSMVQGVSPVVCREIEHVVCCENNCLSKELTHEQINLLKETLNNIIEKVRSTLGTPNMVCDDTKKPLEFSFIEISQYGNTFKKRQYETFSNLLDEFYYEKDKIERIRVKSQDLLKILNNICDRLRRKIILQQEELKQCTERDTLRIHADLINVNLYKIKKGSCFIDLENFYSEDMETIRIKLDPSLSPSQNAQKYYKSYRKSKTAEQMLTSQMAHAEDELRYIESVLDLLSRAETERELGEIRNELTGQGYLKPTRLKQKEKSILAPIKFNSTSGFEILVGRNNHQNDKLTLKQSNNNDIWLHTKDIPGSHTIIVTKGEEPDQQAIIEAGVIAAYHSKARYSSQVPVDYTQIRYVKKPQGSKPGMVIYTNNKTIYVTPDYDIVKNLYAKEGK